MKIEKGVCGVGGSLAWAEPRVLKDKASNHKNICDKIKPMRRLAAIDGVAGPPQEHAS